MSRAEVCLSTPECSAFELFTPYQAVRRAQACPEQTRGRGAAERYALTIVERLDARIMDRAPREFPAQAYSAWRSSSRAPILGSGAADRAEEDGDEANGLTRQVREFMHSSHFCRPIRHGLRGGTL